MTSEEDLLLSVDNVKYRKAGEGKSPIGRISIYRELVQWKDIASPEVLTIKFAHIIGQKESAPGKSKVQLQLLLPNESQATFVFLDPGKTKEELLEQRDALKDTLHEGLLAHRARANEIASKQKDSKLAELQAKQKILEDSDHLRLLRERLVEAKLIKPDEFWQDYYQTSGLVEENAGVSGSFLSTIAQRDGGNGVKLNLNAEIIKAIFDIYPAVQRKHLELVPHQLTEQEFWVKCFQSHYFHREREVIPNPNDPFADCVRIDDCEIEKLVDFGIKRQRLDLENIDDNQLKDFVQKGDTYRAGNKTTLIRRCNYLSEKIVDSMKSGPFKEVQNNLSGSLEQVILSNDASLDSSELGKDIEHQDYKLVKLNASSSVVEATYSPEEVAAHRKTILKFFGDHTNENILNPDDDWFSLGDEEEESDDKQPKLEWDLSSSELNEARAIHSSVSELLKHFWTCFPATKPTLQEKVERIYQAILKYQSDQLQEASVKFGVGKVQHCFDMIERATVKYNQYKERSRK